MPVSSLARFAILIFAGVGTGMLGAVLGIGGGVFLIPILVLGLGLPMHQAIAVGLLSVVATSSAVASTNVERGTANMRLAITLEIATSLGAIAGGLAAGRLSHRALEGLFAVVVVPAAIFMWRGRAGHSVVAAGSSTQNPAPALGALGAEYFDEATGTMVSYRVRKLWAGLGIAFVAGGLSGLLGIGGGVFKVPALHLICEVPMKAAAATSNFMIGVTAAAGAFLYFGRGQVPLAFTATVVLGVLAGSALGSVVNRRLGAGAVQKLFAVLLVGASLQMMYRALILGE